MRWPDRTPAERLWSKVDKTNSCWEWVGTKSTAGYGFMRIKGSNIFAHRLSWEFENGPIPEGMYIDHICHNSACVRPAHLRLATPKQNSENRSGAQVNSKSGVRGVSWHKRTGKWRGEVNDNGRRYHVGLFTSLDAAEDAVREMRNSLFTHNYQDRKAS